MKVLPFKIPKPLHQRILTQIDTGYAFYDTLHQHEEIQISYIESGAGKLFIADSVHPFSDGSIFIIGSNCPHLFKSIGTKNKKVKMMSVFFSKKSFGEDFFKTPELEELNRFFILSEKGFSPISKQKSILKTILRIHEKRKINRFISLFTLLKKLSNCETKTLTQYINPKKLTSKEGERMQRIYKHVIQNFQQDISLESISELSYMTPNSFCRYFKQHTNKTFFQFLIEVRIAHACQLLANPKNLSIAAISEQSGFTAISNFNRKFKALKGKTPSSYKKGVLN